MQLQEFLHNDFEALTGHQYPLRGGGSLVTHQNERTDQKHHLLEFGKMDEQGSRVDIQANSITMQSELQYNRRSMISMQLFIMMGLFSAMWLFHTPRFFLIFSLWIDSSLCGGRSGGGLK